MVDNPKNNPVDDDVGFGNFEDEWSSSGDVDAFGSDDDAFGQEFGSDADPFSSDDGDVLGTGGFDGFEEDDSFHSIPTPDALSAEMEGEADPEDDFGDVGSSFDMDAEDTYGHDDVSDGGFGTDDFNSEEGDAFGDDGAQTTDQVEDVYGDNSYEESAFEEEGDAFSDEEEVAAPPATGSKSKGNLILAGGLAALLGVGYLGYSSVAPMFFGAPSQVVPPVASVPSNSENQFPAGLPGQNGGLPLPSPDVHTSDAGNSNFMPPVGSMDSGQVGMANDETSFAPPLNVDNDEPVVLSLPGLGDSTSPAVALPPVTEASVEDDLVSGERGGIAAMREQGSSLLNSSAVDVQEVLDRIKELEEKFETRISSLMSDIDARFSDFEVKGSVISSNTPDDFDGVDEVISDGTSKRSIDLYAKPPLKPSIIEDMALKGVSRGLAWVETPSGIVEVRVGENISGAGRVLAVKEYNGTWMALTENGLILR